MPDLLGEAYIVIIMLKRASINMKVGSTTLDLLVRLFLQLRVILNCNFQSHELLYLTLQSEY
jgi:hypothetical protein